MHVNRRESENMDDNATPTSSSSVFQLKVSPALLELKDKYRDIDTYGFSLFFVKVYNKSFIVCLF